MDPYDALRAACVYLARGQGGPQGIALGAACLGLVQAFEARQAGGVDISPYPHPSLACGDRGLLLELAEDPDCSPYEWDR